MPPAGGTPGADAGFPAVTFTVTAGRRLDLFTASMHSFLERCGDHEQIAKWLCVDDGSSRDDLDIMRREFPFFEIVTTADGNRGHLQALRLLWRRVETPLVFHTEDDWRFDEDFTLTGLREELAGDDQLVLQREARAVDAVFNPRHPWVEGAKEELAIQLGYQTRPRTDSGWFWPGFSLNPSLFRIDRVRPLLADIGDHGDHEFELALRLHRRGFRARHRSFEVCHMGDLSAHILSGAARSTDMRDLAWQIVHSSVSEPGRAVELSTHLDHGSLDTWTSYNAGRALAVAQWYIDREAGRQTLRELWERHRSTGYLFDLPAARLLDHYGETWESLVGLVEPDGHLETDLARPVSNRNELRRQKRRLGHTVPTRPSDAPKPGPRPNAEVTLVVTSCRRLELFQRTIDSFLACCSDLDRIGRWICIDDGSSDADREVMSRRYPFFETVWKPPEDRGHVRSMQLAQEMVESPYVFLLEDDQEFFVVSDYVTRCLHGLSVGTSVGQCLVNVNYAETIDDYDLAGGVPFQHEGRAYVAQLLDPEYELAGGISNCHWPHFSLRPGLTRTEVWDLGFDDVPFFEREFASRYTARGWRTIFLPDIYHRHIGRLVGAEGDNAYSINRVPQFD